MVVESIVQFFVNGVIGFMDILPDVNISDFLDQDFSPIFQYFRFIAYLLPMDTVWMIASLTLSILMFKIIISTIKSIWALLPFA